MNILVIKSSVFGDNGNSSSLVNSQLAALQAQHPDATVVVRDLSTDPIPHLDGERVGAFFTPADQRSDDQQAVVLRHLKTLTANDVQALTAWAQSQNVQLFTQGDKPAPLQTVWPTQASPLFYEVLGQQLQFTVKNFIQGNAQVNKDMVAQALDWLNIQPQETVLDLFAGIGNFTLPMAKLAKSVVAVEGESAMVAQIEHNAKLNGVDNIQGFAMNLDDEILFARLPKADVVLLDPPRSGAAQMMPWLAKSKARIVYVACEPSALVRDAQILLSKGYTLEKVAVMDMFPQSKHVEAMALFEKHRK